jgi:translation initiation factor 2 beta subunit (eIF-2beta)/eIF-5
MFLLISIVVGVMTPAVFAFNNKGYELKSDIADRQQLVRDVLDQDETNTPEFATIRELFVRALKGIDGDSGPKRTADYMIKQANRYSVSFKRLDNKLKKDVEYLLKDYETNTALNTASRSVIKEAFSGIIIDEKIRKHTDKNSDSFSKIHRDFAKTFVNNKNDERGTMVVLSLLEFLTNKTGQPVAYDSGIRGKKIDFRLKLENKPDLKKALNWLSSGLYMSDANMEDFLDYLEKDVNTSSELQIRNFKKFLKDYKPGLQIYKAN